MNKFKPFFLFLVVVLPIILSACETKIPVEKVENFEETDSDSKEATPVIDEPKNNLFSH